MRAILIPIIILNIQISLFSKSVETDIYEDFKNGLLDIEQYIDLVKLSEDKISSCSRITELIIIPKISEEDILFLQNLCQSNNLKSKKIPRKLKTLIKDYINFETINNKHTKINLSHKKNILESSSSQLENNLKLKFNSKHIYYNLQNSFDKFGLSHFEKNRLTIKNYNYLKEFTLGNRSIHFGKSLNIGGVPSIYNKNENLMTFQESFFKPVGSLPYGLFVKGKYKTIYPYIFHFNKNSSNMNKASGIGLNIRKNNYGMEFIYTNSFVSLSNKKNSINSSSFGLFSYFRDKENLLESEISISKNRGYAFTFLAVNKTNKFSKGISFTNYSNNYFNPLSRGITAFYLNSRDSIIYNDTISFRGIRSSEHNIKFFSSYKTKKMEIKSTLFLAQHRLLNINKYYLKIYEKFYLNNLNTEISFLEYLRSENKNKKLLFSGTIRQTIKNKNIIILQSIIHFEEEEKKIILKISFNSKFKEFIDYSFGCSEHIIQKKSINEKIFYFVFRESLKLDEKLQLNFSFIFDYKFITKTFSSNYMELSLEKHFIF